MDIRDFIDGIIVDEIDDFLSPNFGWGVYAFEGAEPLNGQMTLRLEEVAQEYFERRYKYTRAAKPNSMNRS